MKIDPYWVEDYEGMKKEPDWRNVRGWAEVWLCKNCGEYIIEVDYESAYSDYNPTDYL